MIGSPINYNHERGYNDEGRLELLAAGLGRGRRGA